MAFFDDMTTALQTYPVTDVDLAIVEVVTPGNVLNTSETATFKVRVTNRGPLVLSGVTLRIRGQNGATVANNGALSTFGTEFVTQVLPDIDGHGGTQLSAGGSFKLKAPAGAQASQSLVKATLEAWNAKLDHILNGHSDPLPEAPKGTYAAAVVAS